MPNIGWLHPQIVHFVIALLAVGVIARVLSLAGRWAYTPRWSWLRPTSRALLLVGTLGAVLAVQSGDDAHGPVERIPGVPAAVVEHEELGKRTRNIFLAVVALDLAALFLTGRREQFAAYLVVGAGGLGLLGLVQLYETAEHGGELVYSYAGGVGTKSGDTADVDRLLLAGLYQRAMLDRREGRGEAAARSIDEMARRWPNDVTIKLLAAESRLLDLKDARAALVAVAAIHIRPDDMRQALRYGLLLADAYAAAGHPDSARAVLTGLQRDFPNNARIKDRLGQL